MQPHPEHCGVLDLPQPLHLFESLTGTGHYHYGLFERQEELPQALDRMARAAASHFSPSARVLDIGCGLGGTTHLLARTGLDVLGIDPCPASIAFARSRARGSPANFLETSLESFVAKGPLRVGGATMRFGGLLMIEAMQYFPSLPDFFSLCAKLLDEGGRLVILDVALVPSLPWSRVPCHLADSVTDVAGAMGFDVQKRLDLTRYTMPTLPWLLNEAERRREELVALFRGRHSGVRQEISELMQHMQRLYEGFRTGDLIFELMVFAKSSPKRERQGGRPCE